MHRYVSVTDSPQRARLAALHSRYSDSVRELGEAGICRSEFQGVRAVNTIGTLYRHVRTRIDQESGQGLAEYALILGLIAAVCIGALTGLGSAIANSGGFTSLPGAL